MDKGENFIYRPYWCAQIAQLVEQGTENPCVGGSNPPLGTIRRRCDSQSELQLWRDATP